LVLDRRAQRPWYSSLRGSWVAAVLFLGLLILANVLFPVIAPDFLLDVGDRRDVSSAFSRVDANAVAWNLFTESPLVGIGHGNFDQYHNGETGVHNHLLEQLVSTGLVGGIPYVLFHVLILVGSLRQLGHREGLSRSVSRVLCVSVLATLFAYQFFPGFFVSTFGVISGLIVSRRRIASEAHALKALGL
jgi:O-antigen ligase